MMMFQRLSKPPWRDGTWSCACELCFIMLFAVSWPKKLRVWNDLLNDSLYVKVVKRIGASWNTFLETLQCQLIINKCLKNEM